MANTEKRIRLRTKCFEGYEDVCKNRQFVLVVPSNDLTQQVIPVILPSTDLLKKADTLLPPLFAPLGGQGNIKPLILAPAIQILEPTTPTTTTTTMAATSTTPTTTESPPITTLTPSLPAMQSNETILHINETTHNETVVTVFQLNENIENLHRASKVPTLTQPPETLSVQTTTGEFHHVHPTTLKPSILVLNMEDTAPSVIPSNASIAAQSQNVPKTEYATVEYTPNSPDVAVPAPNLLIDDDSKSNSIHGEFHTKVLTDIDNAPQSLLQPDEPPENP